MTEIDPNTIAKLSEVPAVKAAWNLWQEARRAQATAAGGPEAGRVAVEQAHAAWVEALRQARQPVPPHPWDDLVDRVIR
jgi:hypothetical protein